MEDKDQSRLSKNCLDIHRNIGIFLNNDIVKGAVICFWDIVQPYETPPPIEVGMPK